MRLGRIRKNVNQHAGRCISNSIVEIVPKVERDGEKDHHYWFIELATRQTFGFEGAPDWPF